MKKIKLDFGKTLSNIKKTTVKYGPEILIGIGLSEMVMAIVSAVSATPDAMYAMEGELNSQNLELEEKAEAEGLEYPEYIDRLSPSDIFKTTWKFYVPSFTMFTLGSICILGSNHLNNKRSAALATACAISENTFKEYRTKVLEAIGPEKEQDIRDEIARTEIVAHPVEEEPVIITGQGNTLCYDYLSKRYFRSDIESIRSAINDLNRDMLNEYSVSLNDYYYAIGLPQLPILRELGWNVDRGYIQPHFTSSIAGDLHNELTLVVQFYNDPTSGYEK